MEYRRLGNTGLKVSALSYGAWVSFGYQLGVPQAKELINRCWEAGVNFFDNAEVYAHGEAEEIMGQALKELGYPRKDFAITTKVFFGDTREPTVTAKGNSRKHIVEGLRESLKRLQLDYVDVVFCHRADPDTPIEETVRAMNWVIDQGMAFYWGTSMWSAQQIEEAWQIAGRLGLMGPCVEQPHYNLFNRDKVEDEYKPLYQKYGLGLTTWSPLHSGVLTGKYSKGAVPEGSRFLLDQYKWLGDKMLHENAWQLDAVDKLKPIADDLGCSLAQLALAWCLFNKHVSTVIMGATKMHQLEDNLKAIEVLPKLTPELVAKMTAIVAAEEVAASKASAAAAGNEAGRA